MSRRRPLKLIITCALTGSETYPTQDPTSPDQIAEAAYGAYEAGASIVNVYARNPVNGEPRARRVRDLALYWQIQP